MVTPEIALHVSSHFPKPADDTGTLASDPERCNLNGAWDACFVA
jgi:hypothetical protein